MSNVRKLFTVNAIVAVSLFIGFLNNIAISGIFGLSRAVDAYFASNVLGAMFMYLIVDYVGKNFLPVYASRYHESPELASRVASSIITLMGLVATAIVVILLVFSEPLFALMLPGFTDEDIHVTTRMFAIQAPTIVLLTVNNFLQFIWQHNEQYSRVAFGRMFIPLGSLFFIIGGYFFGNVYALPMGFLAGHILATLVLIYHLPCQYQPIVDFRDPHVRKILTNSALLTGSGLIARLRGPIMQYYGSQLGEGAISAMSLALKLCRPIYQSALMGVHMIVFSRSARVVAKGNIDKLAGIYDYAVSATVLGTLPIAVWIALNAEPLIDLLFLRGQFTDAMAALTVMALVGATGSILFRGVEKLVSHSFYAMHRITVPLVAGPLGTVVYFFATKYLSESYGVFGLTLANSLVAGLLTIAMTFILAFMLPRFSALQIVRRIVMYLVIAVISGLAGLKLADYATLSGLPRLILTSGILFALYGGVLWATRESVFVRILESIRNAMNAKQSANQ